MNNLSSQATSGIGNAATAMANGETTYGWLLYGGSGNAQAIQAIAAAVRDFKSAGDATSETLAQLGARLQEIASGASGSLADALKSAITRIDELVPKALQLEAGLRQNSEQAAALSGDLSGLNANLQSTAESIRLMREAAADNPMAGLNADITKLNEQLQALSNGGIAAYERVKASQADQAEITRRANAEQAEFVKNLVATGVGAQEAERRGAEMGASFVAQATSAVRAQRAVTDGVEATRRAQQEAEEAARKAEAQSREAFARLRRDIQSLDNVYEKMFGDDAELRSMARIEEEFKKRQEEAQRQIEQEEKQRAASFDRTVERYSSQLSTGTTDAIFDGAKKGESALQTLANVFERGLRTAVSSALDVSFFRPAMAEFLNGLGFVGTTGTGGGITLANGAAGATASAGTSYLSQISSALGLGNTLSGGSGLSSLGLGGIGSGITGFLSTPVFGTATMAAPGTLGLSSAEALQAALPAGPASALTYGTALSGAAGLAGGAYGLYSGIQKGGIGGALGAWGGVMSMGGGIGMLAGLGPYGLIAGAVLSLIGSLLPGAKPSNKTGSTEVDLLTGAMSDYSQTGSKFSAENRAASQSLARNLQTIAGQISQLIGGQVQGAVRVDVGNRDGIAARYKYGTYDSDTRHYASDEEGQKQLVLDVVRDMLGQTAQLLPEAMSRAIGGMAKGDVTTMMSDLAKLATATSGGKLTENQTIASRNIDWSNWDTAVAQLTWVRDTYDKLAKSSDTANEYVAQIEAINTKWQANIDMAAKLGLATDVVTAARSKEIKALEDQRWAILEQFNSGLATREKVVNGTYSANPLQQALDQFDTAAKAELEQAKASLTQWGTLAADQSAMILRLETVQAAERAKIIEEWGAKVRDTLGALAGNVTIRGLRARGDTESADLLAFAQQVSSEATELRTQLQSLGLSAAEVAARMGALAAVQEQERRALLAQQAQSRFEAARSDYLAALDKQSTAVQEQISTAQKQISALQSNTEALSNAADGLRDFSQSLLTGGQSPLTPEEQLAELRRQFAEASAKAADGTLSAAGRASAAAQLQSLAQSRLSAAAAYYGTASSAYQAEFNAVRGVLDSVATGMEDQATTQQRQLDELQKIVDGGESQLAELQRAREAAQALGERQLGAIATLQAAMQAAFADLQSALAAVSTGSQPTDTTTPSAPTTGWDEARYLALNSDVAAEVAAGKLASGYEHYVRYGQYEPWRQLEAGGWVGNGVWGRDSVLARYAGGGSVALAGGEFVVNALQAARHPAELQAINAGTYRTAANDNGLTAALLERMQALCVAVARLERTTAQGALEMKGELAVGNALWRENAATARLKLAR